jgi:hypothetical protein
MNDSKESIWIEKYFDIIEETFQDNKYQQLLKDSLDIYKWNNNPPYIFCLSASHDSLSQWRAYSQDGRGVALGFSTRYLKISGGVPGPNISAEKTIGIVDIEYYTYAQRNKIKTLCNEIKTIFDNESEESERILLSLDLGFSLVEWALIFKNISFREEREWRIIHTPTESGYSEHSDIEDRLSKISFRVKNNKILSYFNFSLKDKFNSSLVTEVILGPKCEISQNEMSQFLKFNNLGKTKIIKSKSTYI